MRLILTMTLLLAACDEGGPVQVGPGAGGGAADPGGAGGGAGADGQADDGGGAREGEGEAGADGDGGDDGQTDGGQGDGGDGGGEGDAGEGEDGGGDDGDPCPGGESPDCVQEGPDETRPKVLNVFSPDGAGVTVHFDEDVDPASANVPGNYSITSEEGGPGLRVVAARVQRGEFVALTLDPASVIDPEVRYLCRASRVADLAGNTVDPAADKGIIRRAQYVAIVWHQHQPFYYDPARDEMSGPWVRKHATKDYWDMAAVVGEFPDVHVSINLTPVLLIQLELYLERMTEFVDPFNNTMDVQGFLDRWEGKTDPWIDLLLRPTPTLEQGAEDEATEEEIERYFKGAWATVSTSDPMMARFPEYEALRDKNRATYSREDLLHLKVFFELAWFDPDFLVGPVAMEDGSIVDLSDIVEASADGTYTLIEPATEELAHRLVVENYKVMANVVAVHRRLLWDPELRTGQIEVTTTPFYHPILPLIHDTELARQGQPFDPLPGPPFSYAGDARAHVAKAMRFHTDRFGIPPRGMWPGEGSVAEPVIGAFVDAGVQWIGTDQKVMERSGGGGARWFPYKVDVDGVQGDGGDRDDELFMVFRDTALSDKIGFAFQTLTGEVAAGEFMNDVLANAPPFGAPDRLVTVILDGENAWEQYTKEHDGKGFFRAMYRRLQEAYEVGEVVPVTVSEFIDGNPLRSVPAHPTHEQRELEPLWAGSWIDSTFGIWIGESEENQGWGYLAQTRAALQRSGLPRPNAWASDPEPDPDSRAYWIWRAWEEMYAAEGSDWFWWYGADMTSPGNDDTPFDRSFRAHLAAVYQAMNRALELGGERLIDTPEFAPIVQATPKAVRGPFEDPPGIDGRFTPDEGEWDTVGGFFFDNDSPGAIQSPDDHLAQAFYGYDDEALYVAGAFNVDLSTKQGSDWQLRVYLPHKHITDPETGAHRQDPHNQATRAGTELQVFGDGVAREITVDLSAGDGPQTRLAYADGQQGWIDQPAHSIDLGGPVAGGRLLELRIPFADLDQAFGDPLEIVMVVTEGARELDLAPTVGSKVIFEDVTNLVFMSFEVDVTGDAVALDTYVPIETPPPPAGNGTIYMAGNHDKLDNWNPNSIAMRDDGEGGDAVAGDRIWSRVIGFPPGTILRYKYSSGLPRDEGKWSRTEEFPLTERGLDVPADPDIRGVRVQDTFADRPQPTGTAGPSTVITPE